MWIARSTDPRRSSKRTLSALTRCWRRRSRYWRASAGRGASRVSLPSYLDRRGLWLARHGRPFQRNHSYAPRSPYSASKAASDHLVRSWHHTYGLPVLITNCSNNYGPYHFPEKLIPLTIINGLEGIELPVYGNGAQCARLALCRGSCPGAGHGRDGWSGRRDLLRRRTERKTNLEVVEAICALLDELAPSPKIGCRENAHHFRRRSARPRSALRYRCRADFERAWLEAARDLRNRLAQDGRVVSANRAWWQRIRSGRLPRRAAGSSGVILVFGGNGQLGQELARAAAVPARAGDGRCPARSSISRTGPMSLRF